MNKQQREIRLKKMRKLAINGISKIDIADEFQLCYQYVCILLKDIQPRKLIKPKRLENLKNLIERGITNKNIIMKKLKISPTALSQMCLEANIKLPRKNNAKENIKRKISLSRWPNESMANIGRSLRISRQRVQQYIHGE